MSRRRRILYLTASLGALGAAVAVGWALTFCSCRPPARSTALKLGELVKALKLYEAEQDDLPSTDIGLQALLTPPKGKPYMRTIPLDSWHRPFLYFAPARDGQARWELVSLGPDGLLDSADDVVRVSGFQPPASD